MPRWPATDRSRAQRSSARDAPYAEFALNQLGKRVRALRIALNLTQGQAADAAMLDEKHWQDIEGSRTNPTVATLIGVGRALGVRLSGLFPASIYAKAARGRSRESPQAKQGSTAKKSAARKTKKAQKTRKAQKTQKTQKTRKTQKTQKTQKRKTRKRAPR